MFDSNFFSPISILEKGLQASQLRNEVILNNIANEDTPNFKKSIVDFESVLQKELGSQSFTGKLNLDNVTPTIRQVDSNFSNRMDNNNVDIETEMTSLYKNALKYDVMTSAVISDFKRLNMVLTVR